MDNSKNLPEKSLYDPSAYTDNELYEILDLVNPTDRELEAKILMMVHKYENGTNKPSLKLARFFNDIYNHFFDSSEDEDEYETGQTMLEGFDSSNYRLQAKENFGKTIRGEVTEQAEEIAAPPTSGGGGGALDIVKENTTDSTREIGYTRDLAYSTGKLNPLLKQTIKRTISINSQYRPDKRTMSSGFTFNLSEPLKNVVSLRLYSVQIPYTWYIIGKAYGNNFFYFKGRTQGIHSDTHDIKIEILPGNYTTTSLPASINESIQVIKDNNGDTDMGTTQLVYNSINSLVTINADIKKSYNESSYYIKFPGWTSPYLPYSERNASIPSYLGFQTSEYYTNTIKSVTYSSLLLQNLFVVTDQNNTIDIKCYTGTTLYSTIYVEIETGTFTRESLITNVNTSLNNNNRLINSSLNLVEIDSLNGDNFTGSLFELTIRLNRNIKDNNVNNNPKLQVVFHEDPDINILPIWVNTLSNNDACFGFSKTENNLNTIMGEVQSIGQNNTFRILTSPYIRLTPNLSKYNQTNINDITLTIPNSPVEKDYDISEYVNAINLSMQNIDALNTTTIYDVGSTELPDGSIAFIRDNTFHLFLDINKNFNEGMFEMDLTGSILFDSINGLLLNGANGNNILTDLSQIYASTIQGGKPITIGVNQHICKIMPKWDGVTPVVNGNEYDDPFDITFGNTESKTYINYFEFQNDINNIFSNYIDPISGLHILEGTLLTATVGNGIYNIVFNIKINKRLLTTNYSIQFHENNGDNTWNDNLSVDETLITNGLNMEWTGSTINTDTYVVNADRKVLIISPDKLPVVNSLEIKTGINDKIHIIAYEDGVATNTSLNNIILTIPPTIYSRISLIDAINKAITDHVATTTNITGSQFNIIEKNDEYYIEITLNIVRSYSTGDFDLVFYDNDSFSTCTSGKSGIQNTTWDTTVGWILGYREYTLYDLSAPGIVTSVSGNILSVSGEVAVSINIYQQFMICLDDYSQNHLTDGLVTITNTDTTIPLPSYANRTDFVCDPVTGEKVYNTTTGLTENQIIAVQASADDQSTSIGTSVAMSSYGDGPFVSNVFAMIPLKVDKLPNGSSYVEFGGTLQLQERSYFGPVNIQRMSVRLITDRGNQVDLINADWSFSLICEQLNNTVE